MSLTLDFFLLLENSKKILKIYDSFFLVGTRTGTRTGIKDIFLVCICSIIMLGLQISDQLLITLRMYSDMCSVVCTLCFWSCFQPQAKLRSLFVVGPNFTFPTYMSMYTVCESLFQNTLDKKIVINSAEGSLISLFLFYYAEHYYSPISTVYLYIRAVSS